MMAFLFPISVWSLCGGGNTQGHTTGVGHCDTANRWFQRAPAREALQRFRNRLKQDPQLLRKYREKQIAYNRRYRAKQKLQWQGFSV